ncbi:MAG: thioredoxin domain-containing protein [candidate division WWE3 bacterium]|nr:thioredoxin domain-containing protein [candidate division WWE3 bacterium]
MEEKTSVKTYLTPVAVVVAGIIIGSAIVFKDKIDIKIGSKGTTAGTQATAPTPTPSPTPAPTADLTAIKPTSADTVLGDKNAKVQIISFSDFACPYCSAADGKNDAMTTSLKGQFPDWQPALPNIIKDYVNTGKAQLVFREFPVHGPIAAKAAEAAMCAGDTGKYYEMSGKLFETQTEWSSLAIADATTKFNGYATDLGLNIADCLSSGKHTADVSKDQADGQKAGVTGTPTFFINGEILVGAQPYSAFQKAIDAKL